ncbi:MAG: translation initiation factor IF-2 [Candidatus Omnitrophica bacterium]|nr:translation initiation factor IF-2 [Candidatus Omnitrophota bacterium]
MRVFELAKKLGVTSNELMDLLAKLHLKASSHMATLDEKTVAKVKTALKPAKPAVSSRSAPAAKPTPAPSIKLPSSAPKPAAPGRVAAPPPAPAAAPKPPVAAPRPAVVPPPAPATASAPKTVAPAKPAAAPVKTAPAPPPPKPVMAAPKPPVAPPRPAVAPPRLPIPPPRPVVSAPKPTVSAPKPAAPGRVVAPPPAPAAAPGRVVAPPPAPAAAPIPKPPPVIAPKPPVPAPKPVEPVVSPAAVTAPPVPVPLKPLSVKVPLTVKELAEKLSISPSEPIKRLLGMKILVTINQLLTEETVATLLKLYGYEYQRMPTLEEQIEASHDVEDRSKLIPRPPIVTFMGHVDHGKTSLLDAIRKSKVVETEAGGITQHIGAYQVTLPKGSISFLDTPGHEAFTAMRARGAHVTDIVVLVVAADDGVMPQTAEAIDHAKAADATIVVALNKIDKPSANPDRVKKQLAELGLQPEDWGGKTIVVPVSAKTGDGLDHLLEIILLEAELLELKADPTKPARGIVLEAELSKGRGAVAHMLVQNGTLQVGDVLVSGTYWGRVRAMLDERGHPRKQAGPSTPLEMMGLNGVPKAGDSFLVVPDERQGREVALRRQEEMQGAKTTPRRTITLEEFHRQLEAGRVKSLNLLLKADVQGSLEALRDSLEKLAGEEVGLKVLHAGVGDVTEPDVLLAEASNAVVIGFHVGLTQEAEALAKQEQVDVRLYRIIYEAVADIRAALEGLLEPRLVETVLGRAKVLQLFKVSKVGAIAGCQVIKGKITRSAIGRIIRGQEKLHQGKIESLKRFKDDVREVTEGMQCGLSISGFSDYQPEDVIEAVEVQSVAQKL